MQNLTTLAGRSVDAFRNLVDYTYRKSKSEQGTVFSISHGLHSYKALQSTYTLYIYIYI